MLKIAVFVSGRGSNLKAILDSLTEDINKVEIKAVISNIQDCGAVELALKFGIPVYFVNKNAVDGFTSYSRLMEIFSDFKIDLIVLAGFIKKIPDEFIDRFQNKIINIHPALLPSFGGKGMFGMNVHNAVFNSSAQISGTTVHFVDKIYDNGKIIAQSSVDISDVQNASEIAERVLKLEHQLLPFVIKKIAENNLLIKNERVYLLS